MQALLFVAAVMSVAIPSQVQPVSYVRGDLVQIVRAAGDEPLPNVRVVAVAGDRVQASTSGLRVNGQWVEGLSAQFKEQFASAWDEVVPADHYFVIAEDQTVKGNVSSTVRYHGLIPAKRIAGKAH